MNYLFFVVASLLLSSSLFASQGKNTSFSCEELGVNGGHRNPRTITFTSTQGIDLMKVDSRRKYVMLKIDNSSVPMDFHIQTGVSHLGYKIIYTHRNSRHINDFNLILEVDTTFGGYIFSGSWDTDYSHRKLICQFSTSSSLVGHKALAVRGNRYYIRNGVCWDDKKALEVSMSYCR
jgi:hypothetical protein